MSGEPNTIETEIKPVVRINSDNLIDYLIGKKETKDGVLRGDVDDFEKQIEVPEQIHQVIKEMYESKKEGVLGGESYEKQRMALARELDIMSPGLGAKWLARPAEKVTVEQARVEYLDAKTLELNATSPTYGMGTEVNNWDSIIEATDKGLLVMGIHTHPEDGMLSITDYSQLLIGEPTDRIRLLNAQLVLCPDMQIMAVATKDTPFFTSLDGMGKLVDERNREVDDKNTTLARESLARTKEIFSTKGNPDEAYDEEVKRATGEGAHNINSAFIGFAKEMQVKLYFSQDMRTFKEFSA